MASRLDEPGSVAERGKGTGGAERRPNKVCSLGPLPIFISLFLLLVASFVEDFAATVPFDSPFAESSSFFSSSLAVLALLLSEEEPKPHQAQEVHHNTTPSKLFFSFSFRR